jgi:hypothetical protein
LVLEFGLDPLKKLVDIEMTPDPLIVASIPLGVCCTLAFGLSLTFLAKLNESRAINRRES